MDAVEHSEGVVTEVSPEARLKQWVEAGLTHDAVAVYGTSQAFIDRSLNRGYIPAQMTEATPGFAKYLEAIGRQGTNIYFSHPFADRIAAKKPELVDKIAGNYPGWERGQVMDELSTENIRGGSLYYAQSNAFMHYFSQETGMRFDAQSTGATPIVELAYELIPEEMESKFEEMIKDGFGHNYHRDNVNSGRGDLLENVKRKIPRERLVSILHNTLQQRGVLVYYDTSVLEYAVPGWEAESELLFVTDSPFDLDKISGIEYTTPHSI